MAAYLPVLLGSVNAVPDDSVLSDLPRGQVDYLSHEWREEDVWRSWRNMTRLKNEIANGVRLENASWRTWWKQRNGLKTVTPETLNWLKDSDVTWLYGPLHTADQFVPTPKPSPSTTAALDLPSSPLPPGNGSALLAKKPILKHRSIGELLASDFPLSPMFSPPDSDEDSGQMMSDHAPLRNATSSGRPPQRPSLMHTKSDTHITRWGPNRAFRRDSPPRVGLNGEPSATEMRSSLLQSESPPPSDVRGPKRKHISFNTFVEQCIAIDKPKKKRTPWGDFPRGSHIDPLHDSHGLEDDGYDEDSEDGVIDEADETLFDDDDEQPESPGHQAYPLISHPPSPSRSHHSPPPHNASPSSSSTSEDDDDDDVLEMRVRHPPPISPPPIARSSSHSSSSSSTSSRSRPPKARSASYSAVRPPRRGSNGFIMRSPSTDKELVTIALIAPTILKTKTDEDDHYPFPLSHTHLQSHAYRARDEQQAKDWYSYGAHDTPVELVYVPPSYLYSSMDESDAMVEERRSVGYEATLTSRAEFFDQPMVASPNLAPETPVVQQEGTAESVVSLQLMGPGVAPRDDHMPRYIEAGASSGTIGRTPVGPEVVVSSEDGSPDVPRSRSCSRSRSRSRSRTPSPNLVTATPSTPAIPVPRTNAPSQPAGSALLSPADPGPSRGRSASSPALSSQAQVEQRGRSITRTSSFSDRESLNTGSPLGSLSPDGNLGLGIGSVRVRERDTRGEREGRKTAERGRDRFARRSDSHTESGSNSSLSPEDPCASMRSVVSHQPQPEQPPVSEARKKTGSSSSGSSTVTSRSSTTTRLPPRLLVVDAKPTTQTAYTEVPSIPLSPGCVQEEQESISRQPTPANSPVLQMRSPSLPRSTSPTRPPADRHERKASYGSSRSPSRETCGAEGQQGGTLVGRAVEIMSNAGAFLGSLWHSGAQPGVSTS